MEAARSVNARAMFAHAGHHDTLVDLLFQTGHWIDEQARRRAATQLPVVDCNTVQLKHSNSRTHS